MDKVWGVDAKIDAEIDVENNRIEAILKGAGMPVTKLFLIKNR